MEGTATITVQDAKGKTAEITVTVSYAELVVKEAVTIEASATLELAITSGNGGYEVVNFTANAQLASATINGDKVALTAGTAEGTATVNLQDAKGKTASITVTVVAAGSLIKLDGDNTKTVSYKLGDYPAQVKVTGGDIDTYTPTSSDEEIVTVEITNGGYFHPDDRNLNLTLRGKIGTATVTIEDGTATVAVLTVNVEDSDPIVVSQTDVTISTFMTETLEFTGGASTFTIKQEPEGFVLASTNTWATPKTLSIAPQKSGTTVLTITDEFGKESAAITVRIKLPIKISNTNTYQEYKDTEKIGVVEGKTNKILQIEGGQGTVNVETADASIATATIDAEGYIVISGVSAGEVALTVKDDAMEKTVNVQVIAGPAPGETQCFIVKDDYAIPFGTSDEIKANVAAEMASKGAIIMPSAATKIRKQDYPGYGMCLDGMLTVDLNNITTIEASAMQDFYKTKKFVLRKVQTVGASSFHAYYMEKFTLVLDMDKDAIGDMTIDPTWVGNKGAVIRCRDQECMEAAETAFENSENFGSIEFKNTLE
ncbi:MAG: hypothetical protein CSA97_03900 [Bacteroidetes bacterium]|nr:MAG: hypothetical protein CSA97_03900 [Bacteroidota bacterium]